MTPLSSLARCDVWCASFSADLQGGELAAAERSIRSGNPELIMVDFPKEGPVEALRFRLSQLGFSSETQLSTATHCGDAVARTRTLLLGVRGRFPEARKGGDLPILDVDTPLWAPKGFFRDVWQTAHPLGIQACCTHVQSTPAEIWLQESSGKFQLDPSMVTTGK